MRYQIHEAAKMLGITPQTLRFYEQYGILTHERSGEGGYRQYSDLSMDLLMSLRKCRNCGFTVAQTAEMLKEKDGERIARALSERAAAMEWQAGLEIRIARQLRAVSDKMAHIQACINRYERRTRPEQWMVVIRRDAMARLDVKTMKQVGRMTEWMPLVKWAIRSMPEAVNRTEMGFVTDADTAAFLGMSALDGAERLAACECMYAPVTWRLEEGGIRACLCQAAAWAQREGVRVTGPIMLNTLWNAVNEKGSIAYGEAWLPIG